MRKKDGRNHKEKEVWRIWDALFFSSLISVVKDSEDAKEGAKEFNRLLLSWLFAIVFTVILFSILFWILK